MRTLRRLCSSLGSWACQTRIRRLEELPGLRWLTGHLMHKLGFALTLMLAIMLVAIGGAFYQVNQQASDALLIEMAGRQQVLGQQVARISLDIVDGHIAELPKLEYYIQEFDRYFQRLLQGDPEEGLPPASPKVRQTLLAIQPLWQDSRTAALAIADHAQAIYEFNQALDELGRDLNNVLIALEGAASVLEVAENGSPAHYLVRRQQAVTLRLMALILSIAQGDESASAQLGFSLREFDRNLESLLQGNPDRDIPPAQGVFRNRVENVAQAWNPARENISKVLVHAEVVNASKAQARLISTHSAELLRYSGQMAELLREEAQAKTDQILRYLLALGLVFLFTYLVITLLVRQAVRPLQAMKDRFQQLVQEDLDAFGRVLAQLAQGDLTGSFQVTTGPIGYGAADEVGQIALAFDAMVARLDEMAQAFERARHQLQGLIGHVRSSAQEVADFSHQLSEAALQSGSATQQIADVITHVAEGNLRQSEQVNEVRKAVNEQTRWIQAIAENAEQLAVAAVDANEVLHGTLGPAIAQVQEAAQEGQEVVEVAETSVVRGAEAVTKTIQDMRSIAQVTEEAVRWVNEMQGASRQIDAIVQAIDEIAEQTNLLALNAAIEAARAGEHGRGFAVVADEVRKLSERATRSTREIHGLIDRVQNIMAQMVGAMERSAREVHNGLAAAQEAGQTFQEIRATMERVQGQTNRLARAVEEMGRSSAVLQDVLTRVAAIGEENRRSVQELTRFSHTVQEAITTVSAVTEENSAAATEVSAGAEEISAQMEQTVISVELLANMAHRLREEVQRFRLDPESEETEEAAGSPGAGESLWGEMLQPAPQTPPNGQRNPM